MSQVERSSVAPSRAQALFRRGEGSPRESCLGRSLPRLNCAALRDDARTQIQTEQFFTPVSVGSRVCQSGYGAPGFTIRIS
jgi:hypothetical protein